MRTIRLKKHLPDINTTVRPSDEYMLLTDGLAQEHFVLTTDKDGFINPSFQDVNNKTLIAFVGGSTTECIYVHQENRFPHLVSEYLKRQKIFVNTLNSGVSGNNIFHSVNIIINDILKHNPNYIVLMHNINDLNLLIHEKSYHNNNKYRSLIIDKKDITQQNNFGSIILKEIAKSFAPTTYKALNNLNNMIFDEFFDKRNKKITYNENIIANDFKKALLLFVNISKSQGIKPIIMTQFNRITGDRDEITTKTLETWLTDTGITPEEYIYLYKKLNNIIIEVAHSEDVPLIDLDKLIPKNNKYIYDTVHLNDTGSIFAAEIIANSLAPLIIAHPQ